VVRYIIVYHRLEAQESLNAKADVFGGGWMLFSLLGNGTLEWMLVLDVTLRILNVKVKNAKEILM